VTSPKTKPETLLTDVGENEIGSSALFVTAPEDGA